LRGLPCCRELQRRVTNVRRAFWLQRDDLSGWLLRHERPMPKRRGLDCVRESGQRVRELPGGGLRLVRPRRSRMRGPTVRLRPEHVPDRLLRAERHRRTRVRQWKRRYFLRERRHELQGLLRRRPRVYLVAPDMRPPRLRLDDVSHRMLRRRDLRIGWEHGFLRQRWQGLHLLSARGRVQRGGVPRGDMQRLDLSDGLLRRPREVRDGHPHIGVRDRRRSVPAVSAGRHLLGRIMRGPAVQRSDVPTGLLRHFGLLRVGHEHERVRRRGQCVFGVPTR
jgi:hypothetical protein